MDTKKVDLREIPFEQLQEEYLQRLAEMGRVNFFYTVDSPHRPTSGPSLYHVDARYQNLASVQSARDSALAAQGGSVGNAEYTRVGFGVHVSVPDREDQRLV